MDLKNFLVQAKINTYANEKKSIKKILKDGSKKLTYLKNNFKYRDRYFGSNPFVGEEIVWQDEKIIWSMNYYGAITSDILPTKNVYDFLKLALQKVQEDSPFRGPSNFIDGNFEYIDNNTGDIDFFRGEEIIKYKNKEIYRLYYHGGKM